MLKDKKTIKRLRTISLYGMSQVFSVLSILLLSLIIVKYHSVELWGEYAELLIWSNFFLLFLSYGNQDYLLKSFSNSPSTINQQWISNLLVRSLLLIPSSILIYFIPIFNNIEGLIILMIVLQFLCQSFKVLIVYHRKFIFNIYVELAFNLVLLGSVFYMLKTLDLINLMLIIILAQGFKLICYSFYLFKGFNFKSINYSLRFDELKRSTPFFIPLAVGTIRVRIDAYYGTHFFNVVNLSKYQIFISFLVLAQMTSSFFITPFLKNYYRSSNVFIQRIQKQFFLFGWVFALLLSVLMYVVISKVYQLDFTFYQYTLAFLFMVPLFLHVLIVSEYYKKNKQNKIAYFASIIVFIQVIIGYFLIKNWGINGALILKVLGQWGIVIALWLWIRKYKNNG